MLVLDQKCLTIAAVLSKTLQGSWHFCYNLSFSLIWNGIFISAPAVLDIKQGHN